MLLIKKASEDTFAMDQIENEIEKTTTNINNYLKIMNRRVFKVIVGFNIIGIGKKLEIKFCTKKLFIFSCQMKFMKIPDRESKKMKKQ